MSKERRGANPEVFSQKESVSNIVAREEIRFGNKLSALFMTTGSIMLPLGINNIIAGINVQPGIALLALGSSFLTIGMSILGGEGRRLAKQQLKEIKSA
jgi:hypothetical protein